MKPTAEEVIQAYKYFRRLYAIADPEQGYRTPWKGRITGHDLSQLQEAFNRYLKLNKAFHDGKYCRLSDSPALQGYGPY